MTRLNGVLASIALGVVCAGSLALVAAQSEAIQGPELEQFLTHANVVSMKDLGQGVTRPQKATLELNGVTHNAIFKTIDEKPPSGVTQLEGGVEPEFQDSWRTEVAAYELDKLIGLGFVPTTVERTYQGKVGSLQFWVDSIMDEEKRQKNKVIPPDPQNWNDQIATLRLWDQLIYNTDRNEGNVLITKDWKVVAIDHSRTFRPFGQLKDPKQLTRFSRTVLAGIGTLTEPELKQHLSKYLTPFQIQGILKRRDEIVALAKKLVAEKGEAAVLFK